MLRRSKQPELSQSAIELARMAEQRLGELATSEGADVPAGIDTIVEDLTLAGRKKLLQGFFGELSPMEQYQALAEQFGDDVITDALATHRKIAASNAARQAMLAEVQHDAESGVVHLDKLLPDTRLQLDLFETADFKGRGNTTALLSGMHPNAQLCFGVENDGNLRLTECEINNFQGQRPDAFKRTLDIHQQMRLGSPQGKTDLNPTLNWAAPVYHQLEQDMRPYPISMPGYKLGLGSLWVNGQHISLNET